MKGEHETPDGQSAASSISDEELTNIFEPLTQFVETNSGMVSVGIAAMSGKKWQVPFTIWRAGLKAVTAPIKLAASLSSIAWHNNAVSRAVRFIFNGLAIAIKSMGYMKMRNPKAASAEISKTWQTAKKEIAAIREQKKQAQVDKAKIQTELNINTGRIDKILARVDRKWKESWARAAIKWATGKGVELAKPQILEAHIVKTILDAGPEKVLANKAFQKLVTNPKLIETLEKNSPVIAKVIRRILEETLSNEAKLIRNIVYTLSDKDKPADEEKKTTKPVDAAQMVKSAVDTLVQFKENGGLKALSAIITSSNKPIADYLSKEGGAHLKAVLGYFNLTLDNPNRGTQLVAELGAAALKVIGSKDFDLNRLGQNIALLLSEEPEDKAKAAPDKKDSKVDIIPIVGDILNMLLPLARECISLINKPDAAEWAKAAIASNAEPIASLLEGVLIKQVEQIKKEQAEEKALKKSSSKSKAEDATALDDKYAATQPPSIAPFMQETVKAFASTLITSDQTTEDDKTIRGNLSKITTVLEKVSIILSDSKAVPMKEKISAALEIGEIACELLESPAMIKLLTEQLKAHEAALVPILNPLIGKHIHPAKLIAILSNEKNITKLIQSVRELKQDVEHNKTNLGSYLDIATALLKSKIVRKLAVAVVTQEAANKLAKVGVVIDELVADVKKAAQSFATGVKTLFHAVPSHPAEKTHGERQDNAIAEKEAPEQETKVHAGTKKEDLADKLSSKAKEVKTEIGDKVDGVIDKAKELKAELAHKAKDLFKIKPKHKPSQATDLGPEVELAEKKPTPENKEVVGPEDKNPTLETKPPVPTLPNPEQETKVHAGTKKEDLADKLSSKAKEVKAEIGDKVDGVIDKAKELKDELAHKAKDFFKIKPKHKPSQATDLGPEVELAEKKPTPESLATHSTPANVMKTSEAAQEKKPNKIKLPNPFSKKSKESSIDKTDEKKKDKPGIFAQIGKKLKGVKEETGNNVAAKFSADERRRSATNKPDSPEIGS